MVTAIGVRPSNSVSGALDELASVSDSASGALDELAGKPDENIVPADLDELMATLEPSSRDSWPPTSDACESLAARTSRADFDLLSPVIETGHPDIASGAVVTERSGTVT